jgi:hypothetical protein
MSFEGSYLQVMNQVSELLVWSDGIIGDSSVIEEMSMLDFLSYRNIFKAKYEGDSENKQKFIENTFEFAKKAVEVICKTIAGAYGTKTGNNKLSSGKK